jgi:hypothetical protein
MLALKDKKITEGTLNALGGYKVRHEFTWGHVVLSHKPSTKEQD